jgi:hypothetical protein
MKYLKFLAIGLFFVFTSCATRKGSDALPPADEVTAMVGTVYNTQMTQKSLEKNEALPNADFETESIKETTAIYSTEMRDMALNNIAAAKTTKKAKSFAQMKEMVKNGELTMSKKDFKMLTKLEKLSQKTLSPLREDPFELTDLAKIIFGVGAAGLLIYAFGGGLFFLFLFLLGLGAFLCRWFGMIDF